MQIKQGFAFKSERYVPKSKYRLCTLGNFNSSNDFKFNDDKASYYPEDFPKEFLLSEGDLVLPLTEQTVGLFGNSAFIPRTNDFSFVLNQRVGKVIAKENADITFLHYLLSASIVRDQIEATASGTKQRNTSPEKIYDVDVWVPEFNIQKLIGRCLHKFELKIQLNKKISTELESMAKTLYDYWFTQFDFPDENGKPYRASGGAMEWNEQLKREIPVGWTADIIGNLLSKTPNTARIQTSDYLSDGSIPVIDQSSEFIAGYTNEKAACLSAPSGYIVFGDHTRIVKYICFPFARGADGTQILKSKTPCVPDELLYQIVRGVDLSNQGYARHFKFLKDTLTVVPKETIAQSYAEKVRSIYDMQMKLVFENVELTKLRDWLLPMLMNGQATVLDPEPNAKVIAFQNPKPEQYEVRQAARSFGKETKGDTSDLVKEFIKRRNNDT